LEQEFEGEDYLVFISGDNGGLPDGGGNNCPNETSFCLRGAKAELWQGGVRNNALICSKTMLGEAVGSSYKEGMVHLMDIHASFVEIAAKYAPQIKTMGKKLDGFPVMDALWAGTASPRKSLIHNIDPCSGHGACNGVEAGIRSGDWKYMSGVSYDTWYPVPTSVSLRTAQDPHDLNRAVPQYSQTTWLFNVTADPGETIDLSAKNPDVVKALQAQLDDVAKEAMAPCNVPNGTCNSEDMAGWAVIKAAKAWIPWVKDEL
jgi:arylsulfatase A-like enzyme